MGFHKAKKNLDVRPACVGCVLEARAGVPLNRTMLEASERIRRVMAEKDLSMSDLHRKGISIALLSKWINGEYNCTPEMRPAFAAALEITQVELEGILPRPGRRSRTEGSDWYCARHTSKVAEAEAA